MERIDSGSRRNFLKRLGILIGYPYLSAAAADSGGAAASLAAKYKLAPWTGDEFALCHKLRTGELPVFPEKAEKNVDFVIVGGGVAGLTAAFYLKEENFLLLEQEPEFGGQARGSSYQGIDYTYGAAYLASVDENTSELLGALSLPPVLLPPRHSEFYFKGEWCAGVPGEPSRPLYKEFDRLVADCRPLFKEIPAESEFTAASSSAFARLDAGTFASCLTGYSADFMSLLENCCCWSFGGKTDQISALAGYTLIRELLNPVHVFKGGNQAITKALLSKIRAGGSQRCLKSAFVWKIQIKENGATVTYSLADGSSHRVDCKHVIVATPPLAAARQLVHVPDLLKAQLFGFKYSSYLVANLLMNKKLFKGMYDNFVGAPFSFADLSVAETPYTLTDSHFENNGSVLTVYQPYPSGSVGRTLLLEGDREKLSRLLVDDLDRLVNGCSQGINEIVLTRWGHALAVVSPNYFARLAKMSRLQTGAAYTLAHSCLYGRQNAGSAIRAGKNAAQKARQAAANPGTLINTLNSGC